MNDNRVSQSVSQLFHGPAPRSPLRRLSVRLRRSRSNTSTEYSRPPQRRTLTGIYQYTAVIEDLPRCPTTLYTIPITLCHIPHANQVKPNRTRRVYDACAARYPGAGHWGTHCLISEFLLIIPAVPAPRFPHDISISHMANILDRTRAVSYTVTHNCTQ